MWPMIEMCALVARAGGGAGQERQRPTIPRGPEYWRERVDLTLGLFEHADELRFCDQKALVRDAGVGAVGVTDRPHQPLAAGQAGPQPGRERRVCLGEEP